MKCFEYFLLYGCDVLVKLRMALIVFIVILYAKMFDLSVVEFCLFELSNKATYLCYLSPDSFYCHRVYFISNSSHQLGLAFSIYYYETMNSLERLLPSLPVLFASLSPRWHSLQGRSLRHDGPGLLRYMRCPVCNYSQQVNARC